MITINAYPEGLDLYIIKETEDKYYRFDYPLVVVYWLYTAYFTINDRINNVHLLTKYFNRFFMTSDTNFYEQLTGFSEFTQFTELERYSPLPSDWYVLITDVTGSTNAIENGLYKEVNSLGVASIVALLNAVAPLKVPYVFGGDGATVCIPPSSKAAAESALVAAKQMAKKNFGLDLRIGMVSMNDIEAAGHQILVGKYQPSAYFQQAMFQGDGLRHAESLIKDPEQDNPFQQAMFQGDGLSHAESLIKDPSKDNPFIISEEQIEANGSFEGFECRWNEIPSPHEETVAILVQVLEKDIVAKEIIYQEVSQKILNIYGDEKEHHPLRMEKLSLTNSAKKLSNEVKVRVASLNFWSRCRYILKLELLSCVGRYLMRKKVKTENTDWGNYKQILIENSDYRKFDEVLRMIISGTLEQRNQLTVYLEQLHKEKKIVFGIHASPNALITCLVFNYDTDHVHFLDGADGGYAMAAKDMKKQLKELYSS